MKNQNGKNDKYVLDSTAFLAFIEDEDGSETVQEILEEAKKEQCVVFASFVSFTEIFYISLREKDEKEAKSRINLMNKLPMTRVESFPELGLIAGNLKTKYKISFADTWIAATAIFFDAILVHKDPEFDLVEEKLKVLRLPYKK